jgi:hypothetical protein
MHRLCFANSGHNKSDNGLSTALRTNSSVLHHTLALYAAASRAQTVSAFKGVLIQKRGGGLFRKKENISCVCVLFSDGCQWSARFNENLRGFLPLHRFLLSMKRVWDFLLVNIPREKKDSRERFIKKFSSLLFEK